MLQKILPYASYVLTTPVTIVDAEGNESTDPFRRINRLADCVLSPVRYLLNDNPEIRIRYYMTEPDKIYSTYEVASEQRRWIKTLFMISSFVPALILGVIGKAIALTSTTVRKDIAHATNHHSLHAQIKASNAVLAPKFKDLRHDVQQFYQYLKDNMVKGKAIWDEVATQTMFDALIQKSALFMDTLFVELATCAKSDAKKMAELLSYQPHNYMSEPLFCYCFFKCSIWSLYEMARNKSHYEDPQSVTGNTGGRPSLTTSKLTREDEAPFFKEGTKQYSWRLLYNQKASKLDDRTYTSPEDKTLRDYVREFNVGDDRCNMSKDETPVDPKLAFFIALRGYPTMSLPESLN